MPHFVYSFTCWWIFGLSPVYDQYKQSFFEILCTRFCVSIDILSSCIYPGIAGFYSYTIFNVWETTKCFLQKLHHFTVLPTKYESVSFFTTVSICAIVHLIDYGYPNMYIMVSHLDIHLHFLMTSGGKHFSWLNWPIEILFPFLIVFLLMN